MKFVTIATFFNLVEAEMIRSRLEAASFHPFLANENAASWMGGNPVATPVRLQVPENEFADAKIFLAAPAE